MSTVKMGTRALQFLLSEASGTRSRSSGIVPAGTGKVAAGMVVGQLTANAKHFVPSPDVQVVGIEGAETATAILAYPVDATDVDVEVALIDRDGGVKLPVLSFGATVDDQPKTDAKIAQLNAVGIRAR